MEKLLRLWKLPCIALAALVVWCAASAPSSASTSSDDSRITRDVQTAIFQQPMLRTSFLNVYTRGGVVQLTGNAERPVDVEIARELAARTPGVVEVRSELVTVRDHIAHGR